MLTQKRLKQLFFYNTKTGLFTRLCTPRRGPRPERVGTKSSQGYLQMWIDGVRYSAHRVIWFYMTGSWPENEIDHVNGERMDNKWSNLRDATRTLNLENQRRANSRSTTGFLGISPNREKFQAQIKANGVRYCLGNFHTAEQAHAAYLKAKRKLHLGNTL